nr:fatty acid desaturase [Pseudenhygromyxa sp. WMMC2535]
MTVQPSVRFRRRRAFYVLYDGTYLVGLSIVLALMLAAGFQGLVPREFHWWYWLVLPLAVHAQILCSVFIHNCSHNNFPRPINRLIGELCGLVVLTRYASWEIIHCRHHKYSDDADMDPHPVTADARGYWPFLKKMVVNVEVQLQRQFFELHGGDTPENRRFEKRRAYTSYATNLVLIAFWYVLLGPMGFFFFFVPASIIGFFHLVHFNWSTHNAAHPEQGFYPVNLDHGYFWIGNRLWYGIYYHGYHHKQANLFNPRHYEAHQKAKAERLAARQAKREAEQDDLADPSAAA